MQTKKKILVVEDFDDARKLFVLYLKCLGFEVLEASDGREALENSILLRPDLIIMDITMPHMDGHEATALIKENPSTRHIPIIVMTAHTSNMHVHAAHEAGADEVLFKPVNLAGLREILGRYFGNDSKSLTARPTQDDRGIND